MSLCKASLPSQCSLSVLSVPSLDASADPKLSSSASDHAERSGAIGSGFPTVIAGMSPGAQSGPVTVSVWGELLGGGGDVLKEAGKISPESIDIFHDYTLVMLKALSHGANFSHNLQCNSTLERCQLMKSV